MIYLRCREFANLRLRDARCTCQEQSMLILRNDDNMYTIVSPQQAYPPT